MDTAPMDVMTLKKRWLETLIAVRRFLRWLRRMRYRILIFFGRIQEIEAGKSDDVEVEPPTDDAPLISVPARFKDARIEPKHRKLLLTAVSDLFDHLGLIYVPRMVVDLIDKTGNIETAFHTFVASVGCDYEAVRTKDKAEIKKLSAAITLLIDLESIAAGMTSEQLNLLYEEIFQGDYDRVKEFVKVADCLNSIFLTRDMLSTLHWFAAYTKFIESISVFEADPMSISAHEAVVEFEKSELYDPLIQYFDEFKNQFAEYQEDFERAWPEDADIAASGIMISVLAEIESLIEVLETNATLVPEKISNNDPHESTVNYYILEIAPLLEEVQALFETVLGQDDEDRTEGAGAAGSTSGRNSDTPTLEDALDFFGIDLDEKRWPTQEAFERRCKKIYMANHPDTSGATDPDEIDRRNKIFRETRKFREVIYKNRRVQRSWGLSV